MANFYKIDFKYASNGIENTRYQNVESTEIGDYIIDASNLTLITHKKVFPFMRISDIYGQKLKNKMALSQNAGYNLYNSILDISSHVKNIENILSTDSSFNFQDIINGYEELEGVINNIKELNYAEKTITIDNSIYNIIYENKLYDILHKYNTSICSYIDTDISILNQNIKYITDDVSSLNQNINYITDDVSSLNKNVNDISIDVSILKDTINDLSINLSNDISILNSNIDDIDATISLAISNLDTSLNNIIAGTFNNKYTPSENIPSSYSSTTIGYMPAKTKDTLSNMTYDEILDSILFKDIEAVITYNTDNNKITGNDLEYLSDISIADFTIQNATATYKYVNGTESSKKWTNAGINKLDVSIANVFGTVNKCVSTLFTFTPPENITITSAMGVISNTQLTKQTVTKYGSITTYVKIYYVIGDTTNSTLQNDLISTFNDTSINDIKKTFSNNGTTNAERYKSANLSTKNYQQCGDWSSKSLEGSSFIYILLPNNLTINTVIIRNGISGADDTLNKNLYGIVQPSALQTIGYNVNTVDISINEISTLNKYNIWFIAKSGYNNDNTVTANSEPIKIQIIKK